MLKRFYADNFRCLVNFEFRPGGVSLLVGRNGSGKTTLLQCIRVVRDFLLGGNLTASFQFSKTLWETRLKQRFELDLVHETDTGYQYVLEIDHADRASPRLLKEELSLAGRPLFRFADGRVQLFTDEHEPRGESFEYTTETSALVNFVARGSHLERFRQAAAGGILFFSLDPRAMEWKSIQEAKGLSQNGHNLPSWLRTVSQDNPRAFGRLTESLAKVVTGFEQLRFRDIGDGKLLEVVLAGEKHRTFTTNLPNLSDGERCLIALYAILHAHDGQTLVFDEPDNFVALDEIRPWLYQLRDSAAENKTQLIVASHHPDIIDYLAADDGFLLSRPTGDVVRIGPLEIDRETADRASEELRERLAFESQP